MATKLNSYFTNAVLAVATVFGLAQCADEQTITEKSDPFTEAAQVTDDGAVSSFTVSGVHTIVTNDIDCSTCTYFVPPSARVVDGNELKFLPGTVICLNKAIKYQRLEFVNIKGTEDKPVIIASCGE